ncbi:zonadhesin [Apis mellifera carnica]|nr:zonadhesin [Apis mellifera carnica]
MKCIEVHFVLIILNVFLLEYLNVVTGEVLFKPEIIHVEDICRKNEIFSRCQADPNCEKNCDNVDIWESMPCIQTKNCLSGCICDKGYVRDNNQGICVLENSCPRIRH